MSSEKPVFAPVARFPFHLDRMTTPVIQWSQAKA